MSTYKIVRGYFNEEHEKQTIRRGLTLAEAQKHCRDPETSSKTCKLPANKARTVTKGPWFDGYEEE